MIKNSAFDILSSDILAIQRSFANKNFSAEELVRFNQRRIELLDKDGPRLNAVITINPDAEREAKNLDLERKTRGIRGPLHGITIALKDNFNTRDMPTTAGSKALKHCRPEKDAFIVEKLRKAGAIIIAKVNLHEMARSGTTAGSMIGQTLNPYDLTRTPGGSSGGTAVAVAAGFCAAGMGADTVNSIRSPASAACLVGFRPTKGLLSRSGLMPVSLTQDTAGPITGCVSDSAILLEAVSGFDPDDPATAEPPKSSHREFMSSLNADVLKGKRLGLLLNNFGSDPEVLAVMKRASEDMAKVGAVIVDVYEPDLTTEKVIDECDVILYETKPHLNRYLAELGPKAPIKNIKELLASGLIHSSIRKGLSDAEELDDPLSMTEYRNRLLRSQKLRERVLEIMTDKKLDALVYPHQRVLVAKIGEPQHARNGILSAVTGFPAVTVPAGFSGATETAPIGVPIGIEFFSRPWDDYELLGLAYSYEQLTRHRKPPLL